MSAIIFGVKRIILVLSFFLLSACQPASQTSTPLPPTSTPAPTLTPEPPITFPVDINPLTGQPVADPALLKIPALLISISHFPATGRPQAGLSFAPFVYEIYITEGATRFLAVFYGEFPAPEAPVTGNCEIRRDIFQQTGLILGNRIWLDANGNGVQDVGEKGIGGVCVNLYDANGNLIQQTTTDTNGYYGFNVQPGRYTIEFIPPGAADFRKPAGLEFTTPNVGDDTQDSDADPATDRVLVDVSSDDLSLDAGLIPSANLNPNSPGSLPLALVGPIRSGRLVYGHIADFFQNSCLIYAFASEEVLVRLPQCHMVFHQLAGGGYMMDISEMRQVAEQNQRQKGSDFDYASNIFSEELPAGGVPAKQLKVYVAYQNQSGWFYDPLYQAYSRYVDTSEYDQAGILHADVDRLTGRQLHFENVIVLFADHEVISPTNLDIHLDQGKSGNALLFRDGQMFKIRWSARGADDRNQDRKKHPIVFLNMAGKPMPLKPGHTWVIVVTPNSTVEKSSAGAWQLRFSFPPGAR
jgi:hypothetical protein